MNFTHLHHVSINVDDVAATTTFYSDVLGFVPLERPEIGVAGAWFAVGEQQVHLIEMADWQAPDGPHFALRVDDIDAAVAELVNSGVHVSPISEIDGVCRQAFFRDPSRNLLELNEPAH